MRGTLKRISKGEKSGKTRTEDITGTFHMKPTVGIPFDLFGKPINPDANFRLWSTSTVAQVEQLLGGWKFKTESGSVYEVMIEDNGLDK